MRGVADFWEGVVGAEAYAGVRVRTIQILAVGWLTAWLWRSRRYFLADCC